MPKSYDLEEMCEKFIENANEQSANFLENGK